MIKLRHAMTVLALCAVMGTGCSCEPLVNPPPTGGGNGGGTTGGGGGGGGGATGGGGGATGGGGGATGGGGGATGGGGGATGGGGGTATVQLTEYVRDLIVTGTNGTSQARPEAEFRDA